MVTSGTLRGASSGVDKTGELFLQHTALGLAKDRSQHDGPIVVARRALHVGFRGRSAHPDHPTRVVASE